LAADRVDGVVCVDGGAAEVPDIVSLPAANAAVDKDAAAASRVTRFKKWIRDRIDTSR